MYSTDLAPSDYHLFLHIKKFQSGQRLSCDQDTKQVMRDWLKGLAANFFEEGWSHDEKYFNLHGD
jgi:hypothetical protein